MLTKIIIFIDWVNLILNRLWFGEQFGDGSFFPLIPSWISPCILLEIKKDHGSAFPNIPDIQDTFTKDLFTYCWRET